MSPSVIPLALLVLAIIGTALFCVALGIYNRLGLLIGTIAELRSLAEGSQDELEQTRERIGKVHSDIGRLVANANVANELVRNARKLPTR